MQFLSFPFAFCMLGTINLLRSSSKSALLTLTCYSLQNTLNVRRTLYDFTQQAATQYLLQSIYSNNAQIQYISCSLLMHSLFVPAIPNI